MNSENIQTLYHNLDKHLKFNKNNPYIRKNIKKSKSNEKLPINVDPLLIHYNKLKKTINSYFPNCYKGNIKIILYKLYLISQEKNVNIFENEKRIKVLLYLSFVILQSNIKSLQFENIYGFYKIRRRNNGDFNYDDIYNSIEMRIICDYLLEKCFIKGYSLLINSSLNLNNLNLELNVEKITPFKEDVIVYKTEEIQLLIQQYILDIKSSYLNLCALSKCVFDTEQHCSNLIDLNKLSGMYVLSHSTGRVDDVCIVPDNTLFIFLQNIGKKCVYYPSIMGNTNLLIVYEILYIISQELNKQTFDIKNIEKILLANKILQDIYRQEYNENSLRVYLPGQMILNQTIVFQEKKQYTLQHLLEQTEQKKRKYIISNGIISFEKLISQNKIYPIKSIEPSRNNLINVNNDNLNLQYNNVVEEYPLSISSKTIMGRILDEKNVYYQSLNKILEHREPLISDLLVEMSETQKIYKKLDKVKSEILQLESDRAIEKTKNRIKYLEEQLSKKGYIDFGQKINIDFRQKINIEISKKLNIVIFSMCRTIIDNEGIIIYKGEEKIVIPIQNKQYLGGIIGIIDSSLNYNTLVYRFKIQKEVIQLEYLIQKLHKRIRYTNYYEKLKNPMMRGALVQYMHFSSLGLKEKINVINDFYRIEFNAESKYDLDTFDQLQYLVDNPLRHKINYVIITMMKIDLGLHQNVNELLEYYNSNYILNIEDSDEFYKKTIPMSDYMFLYYLSTL